ncbi:hypothetical protein DEFDS_P138 (plasmid) [Deferribacter desulfuricans SSM1]|uniref:Uncharacterized protein n=2 Tax=Deferribacter TaxID=53572 RepID=D3PEW8_DEFDS|nr:hypothetical protein DEFDS_P138 [Deferribacter desulfuricans SSM1]
MVLETYQTIKDFLNEFDETVKKSQDKDNNKNNSIIFMAENHLNFCLDILDEYINFLPELELNFEILEETLKIKEELIKFKNKYTQYQTLIDTYINKIDRILK